MPVHRRAHAVVALLFFISIFASQVEGTAPSGVALVFPTIEITTLDRGGALSIRSPAPDDVDELMRPHLPPLPSPAPIDPEVTPLPPPAPKAVPPPRPVTPVRTLAWPVSGTISQYYHAGHQAIDISANCGRGVVAAGPGVVTFSGWRNNGGGFVVEINHGWAVTSYNHLSALFVLAGTEVAQGHLIAAVGTTGISTGCHLHLGVLVSGRAVDPLAYLR